jgi:ABC-type branched-subunit amino acid transport system substrate-binding protein
MSLYAPPPAIKALSENDLFMSIVDYFKMTEEKRFFTWRSVVNSAYLGYSSAYLATKLKGLTGAIVVENRSSFRSRELSSQFRYYFERAGGKVKNIHTYDTDELDPGTLVQRISGDLGSGKTLLYLSDTWTASRDIVKGIRALGKGNIIIGTDEWGYTTFTPEIGESDPGECYFISPFNPFAAEAETFVEKYERVHHQLPGAAAALGYDTFMFIHESLNRTDQMTRDEFMRLIPHVSLSGATGRTEYGKGYDPLAKTVYAMKYTKDGLKLEAKLSVSPYRLEKAIFPEAE